MTRASAAALLLCAALGLSGCSAGDEATSPPDIGSSERPTASVTTPFDPSSAPESPTPGASSTGAFDDKGHDVLPGKVATRNAEQNAVSEAWLAYWRVRLASYDSVSVDPVALGQVATGSAASEVTGYVETLRRRGHHTVGDMTIGVSRVRVHRDRARLRSCIENRGTDRTEAGKPVEVLTPFYLFAGTLERASGGWRVSSLTILNKGVCS